MDVETISRNRLKRTGVDTKIKAKILWTTTTLVFLSNRGA